VYAKLVAKDVPPREKAGVPEFKLVLLIFGLGSTNLPLLFAKIVTGAAKEIVVVPTYVAVIVYVAPLKALFAGTEITPVARVHDTTVLGI
jgi:hypothetical protein